MPRKGRRGSLPSDHDDLSVFVPPHELAASSLMDPSCVSGSGGWEGSKGHGRLGGQLVAVSHAEASCQHISLAGVAGVHVTASLLQLMPVIYAARPYNCPIALLCP